MNKKREELLQTLIEKMGSVMKGLHAGLCFPFGEFQLNRLQIMILFFIAKKKNGASSKDLAAFLNVTPGAITQFIDVLAQKKLVRREDDLKDRRILSIKLTKSAKAKFAAFKKTYYKSVSPVFNELNEKEIQQFISLLNKINIVSS